MPESISIRIQPLSKWHKYTKEVLEMNSWYCGNIDTWINDEHAVSPIIPASVKSFIARIKELELTGLNTFELLD